jgi:lipopolysaccharide export LptBFGC system permease protein LptF
MDPRRNVMVSWIRKCTCLLLIVCSLLFAPSNLKADHVVTPQDLHSALQSASQTRQQNITQIKQFLSSDVAREAMNSMKADPQKVSNAIPLLSDDELARLANQTNQAQMNFAAGYHYDIIWILLVILLVVAIVAIATH